VVHRRKKKARKRTSRAIVKSTLPPPVIIQRNRERELTPEEVNLVKNTCCKEGSEEEFALFLYICKKHRVDPLVGQIFAIFFNATKHHKDERGIWCPGKQMVIVMGINGYRSLAARQHKDYGGCKRPEYVMTEKTTPAGRKIPSECTIALMKKGMEYPTEATVYWDEFAPADLGDDRAKFWNTKPKHMLAKCAESQALRRGYPDLADIYTVEEMAQAVMNYTPEGREFFIDGKRPDGTAGPAMQRQIAKDTQKKIVDAKVQGNWCEKHRCPKDQCPADEHTKEENDKLWEERQTVASAKNVTPQPEEKRARPRGPQVKEERVKRPAGLKVNGTLHNTYAAMTRDNRKYLTVKVGPEYYKCYRPSIFPFLEKGCGNAIEFFSSAGSITGLIRIGQTRFEEDGKTRVQA